MEKTLRQIGGTHLHEHSIHLYKLIRILPEDANVLEIGAGRSTVIILNFLKGTLYSIDQNPRKRKIASKYSNWKFIEGYDLDILKNWKIPLDLVFVDIDRNTIKDHYYTLLNIFKKHLRKNGIIVIYNTCVFESDTVPAIEQFLQENPTYHFINLTSRHGFGIITEEDPKIIKEILK